ncbi:hypothetical protein GN244_ATG19046 [Phytophthora infestans]|uniref:Uncharacterized protein n=1 Tax=Phytophthora infestans TaxID=4787 RepID=A0A833S7R3_PHYIN|nr:hypothetical protein GN244_ATG19046 [Phytophthora infestans]
MSDFVLTFFSYREGVHEAADRRSAALQWRLTRRCKCGAGAHQAGYRSRLRFLWLGHHDGVPGCASCDAAESYGRDEHQTLLSFEDPMRRVFTVPSPIVGGVFLHAQHINGSKTCNPDPYNSKNNFIIPLVTIFATVRFGIQLGHDCIDMVLTDGAKLAAAQISGSDSSEAGSESN